MRSDHLKSHMKKHADLSLEDPEQICKSVLENVINDIHNKDETSMHRKKPKEMICIQIHWMSHPSP